MRITIFGATGSVGQQVIKYLRHTKHDVVGISYYKNIILAKNIKVSYFYSPINKSNVASFEQLIIKSKPDLIVNAIVGFDGLEITLLSIKHKINLALANKESLVVAGQFVTKLAKKNKVNIYPIDSEHTSLMHIIKNRQSKFKRLYITASGGPFYNAKRLDKITFRQAINHPTWKMGHKISMDSATLMNKCFEIIECYWYFRTDKISVLYHPQSLVHAIVEYDKQSFACVYEPSMIVPIKMVFDKFNTLANTIEQIDFKKTKYHLEKIKDSLPIKWGYKTIQNPNSSLGVILNAANEVAFERFKSGEIKYTDIIRIIEKCLLKIRIKKVNSIQEIYEIDKQTRCLCQTV